jgi:hypothetical protein
MTKHEASKLLATIAAAYPSFESNDYKVKVWGEMLDDLSYEVVNAAAKKCIVENTFPPSIAELRKAAFDLLQPEAVAAPEAWGQVIRAVHNYGFARQKDALNSLPPDVAEVVRWMGWREICHSENLDVVRGQFIKLFETQRKREQQLKVLPQDLKAIVTRASEKLLLKPAQGGSD